MTRDEKPQADRPALVNYVRKLMERNSLYDLPTTADVTGVSVGAISNLLNEKVIPRPETLVRLADTLNGNRALILYYAGYLDEIPGAVELDPSVVDAALRINEMPVEYRIATAEAVDGLVGGVNKIVSLSEQRLRRLELVLVILEERYPDILQIVQAEVLRRLSDGEAEAPET